MSILTSWIDIPERVLALFWRWLVLRATPLECFLRESFLYLGIRSVETLFRSMKFSNWKAPSFASKETTVWRAVILWDRTKWLMNVLEHHCLETNLSEHGIFFGSSEEETNQWRIEWRFGDGVGDSKDDSHPVLFGGSFPIVQPAPRSNYLIIRNINYMLVRTSIDKHMDR